MNNDTNEQMRRLEAWLDAALSIPADIVEHLRPSLTDECETCQTLTATVVLAIDDEFGEITQTRMCCDCAYKAAHERSAQGHIVPEPQSIDGHTQTELDRLEAQIARDWEIWDSLPADHPTRGPLAGAIWSMEDKADMLKFSLTHPVRAVAS